MFAVEGGERHDHAVAAQRTNEKCVARRPSGEVSSEEKRHTGACVLAVRAIGYQLLIMMADS